MTPRPGAVALVVFLRSEWEALRGALPPDAALRPVGEGCGEGWTARDGSAVVRCPGVGWEASARLAEELRRMPGLGRVLALGFCGGLDPALKAGDMVAASATVDQATGREYPLDPGRSAESRPAARLLTVREPVFRVADKARLFAETGAAAVDMETAALARGLDGAVPMSAFRFVLDDARTALPPQAAGWIGADGRSRPLRVAADLALRPWLIATVVGLAYREALVKRALRELAAAIAPR